MRLGPVKYACVVEFFGTSVPPVWFRFSWYGDAFENSGQSEAALVDADEFDDALEMDGSDVVT